jgi:hypothetical protein
VADDDTCERRAFGTGGANVVLGEHVKHPTAGEASEVGGVDEAERDGG